MVEMREVCIPTIKKCHIQYYVWVEPDIDPHFHSSPYILKNQYFETREEAKALKAKYDNGWDDYYIREKLSPIEED